MNYDRGARLLIMAAYLYYRCDVSIMSDGDYDKLSLTIAKNWDKLSDQMKWQLGDREAIRSTGMGILITQMGQNAAHAWYLHKQKAKVKKGLTQPFLQDAAGFSITNNGDYQGPHPKFKCLYAVI